MTIKQKKILLNCAIGAGLLSLPMTWFTIHNAQLSFPGGFGGAFPAGFGSVSLNVTGLSGNVRLIVSTPLWFVVGVAIAANIFQLMRNSLEFEIPKLVEWTSAIVAVVWMTVPIVISIGSGRASIAMGWVLAMFCAVTPLACLILERNRPAVVSPPTV